MDAFLPYFAGFFDREGSIGIYSNTSKYKGRTLRVQVTQNVSPESTVLLKEAQRRWGGCLTVMNRHLKRTAWMWQVSASKGVVALREMRPWLRLKAEQADIAIGYWDERTFMRRDQNGRFLPLSSETRRQGEIAEAALKAAKQGQKYELAQVLLPHAGWGGAQNVLPLW